MQRFPLQRFRSGCISGVLIGWLSACSIQTVQTNSKPAEVDASAHQQSEAIDEPGSQSPMHTPLDGQSFYTLLLAELLSVRAQPALAQEVYAQLLNSHADAALARRATELAQSVQNFEQSLASAQQWAEIDPLDPAAHEAASEAAFHLGESDAFYFHLDQALTLDSNSPVYAVNQAIRPNQGLQPAQLVDLYQRLLTKHPKAPFLWLAHAQMARGTGNPQQALASLQHSLALKPWIASIIEQFELYQQMQQPQQAKRALAKGLQQFPDHPELQLRQVEWLLSQQQVERALQQMQTLQQTYPNNARIALIYARIALDAQRFELARPVLQGIVDDPAYRDAAWYFLAQIAQQQQQPVQAVRYYQQVQPSEYWLPALREGVALLLQMRHHHQALQWVQQSLKRLPSVALYELLADLYRQLDQPQQAYNSYSQGLERFANHPNLLYGRALVAESLQQLEQAEQDLRQILQDDADHVGALNALGYTLLVHSDRLTEAHQLILQAYQLRPDDPSIQDSLGWSWFKQGQWHQALPLLQQAFAQVPNAEIAAHLGEVLWMLNEPQQARQVWAKGLNDPEGGLIIEQTLQRLQVERHSLPNVIEQAN